MGTFDEADIKKSYACAQGKDDETVTIVSRSHHTRRKFKAMLNDWSPPGIYIAPYDDTSIASGLILDADADDDASLLGGAYLVLDPAGYNVSLLGDYFSLTGGYVYPLGGESLRESTETWHTSVSKDKYAILLLNKQFNATRKKEIEANTEALAEATALKFRMK